MRVCGLEFLSVVEDGTRKVTFCTNLLTAMVTNGITHVQAAQCKQATLLLKQKTNTAYTS